MQDKELEKIKFDEFTTEEPWHAFSDRTYSKIVGLFLTLAAKKRARVIDMGCGTGELTKKLLDFGFKNVSGYDISKNCISMARKNYSGIDFQVRDIENTGLKENSVDFLFYCGILHHFTDMEDVLKEARRILKNGGRVFVFEPNAKNPVLWLLRDEKSPFKSEKLKTPNEKFLTKIQIKGIFEKYDFNVIRLECISGISYTKGYFKKLLPFPFFYSVYLYNAFDAVLNRTFLRKKHGSFIYGYFEK